MKGKRNFFIMNQKGFINVALIILVIVIASAIGYFVLTKESNVPAEQTQSTNTPPQSVSPAPNNISPQTSQPNETANWKTYQDNKYDFEFRYPEDLTYEFGKVEPDSGILENIIFSNKLWVIVANTKSIRDGETACENVSGQCSSFEPLRCLTDKPTCQQLSFSDGPLWAGKKIDYQDVRSGVVVEFYISFSGTKEGFNPEIYSDRRESNDDAVQAWTDKGWIDQQIWKDVQLLNQITATFRFIK